MKNRRAVGTEQERRAAAYLMENGYEILAYNFRCRFGEIDLIAKDGEYLVFLEVKYRAGDTAGEPQEAVDRRKQKRICRSALYYCTVNGYAADWPCRFDVVAVKRDEITVFKNAFLFLA